MDANIAALVRQARQRAGLSRGRLAHLAGLSESTVKNVEAGRHVVSTTTLRSLLRVAELDLAPDACAQALGAFLPASHPHAHLNAWIAPGFDPITTFCDLSACYAGVGGHVEQSAAYFDHASAAAWCAIASQQDYAQAIAALPLDQLACAIAHQLGAAGIDMVALGPGDGRLETRLLLQIARHLRRPTGRFFLLDISQPLLGAAYQHAAEALSGAAPGITAVALQGDFHRLPQYMPLLSVPPGVPRRQVVVMVGGTFANLDNEVRFVRDSLCGFGLGSLLLLDYPGLFGATEEEQRRRDPWLTDTTPLGWRGRVHDFLCGPLRRYCPDAQEITLTPQLAQRGLAISGGYAVEVLARVKAASRADRVFSVFRLKRYRRDEVIAALHALGWQHMSGVPYGHEVGYERTLSLFRRS